MTGLVLLFLWSFAAATILPLSSEIPLVYAVRRGGAGWLLPVAVATAGNYLGACTTYWLARLAVERAGGPGPGRTGRAAALIARYGPPALLMSWVPLVGDALVALAGAAGMPFGRFSIWTLIGKAVRYGVLAWIVRTG